MHTRRAAAQSSTFMSATATYTKMRFSEKFFPALRGEMEVWRRRLRHDVASKRIAYRFVVSERVARSPV